MNKNEEILKREQQKQSFFHFGKRGASKPVKNEVPSIKLIFQVEDAELTLQGVLDYANSRFVGENNVVEVIVVDNLADEKVLSPVRKAVAVNVEEPFSVIYLMDCVDNRIDQITSLCVKGIAQCLRDELDRESHIIRITK